jgi:dolichol-phosphate mannosyltransferase
MPSALPPPRYSVVAPFFNEAENIPAVLQGLRPVMDGLGAPYEVLLVNDGSTDATGLLIDEAGQRWPEVRGLHFARNIGQAGALLHGLRNAAGEWILTMDGDGQHDPADFRVLLQRTTEADFVIGMRQPRCDRWLRRAMSRLANAVRRRVLQDQVTDAGCALKVFRREIVGSLLPIRSLYSFIPAMAVKAGYKVIEVPVQHLPRRHGHSSYGLSVFFWRPAADMIALWWLFKRSVPHSKPGDISAGTFASHD